MSNQIERLAYSIKTFAELAELSESTIKREIYAGNLKAVKRRGRVIISAEAARAYLTGDSQEGTQTQTKSVMAPV